MESIVLGTKGGDCKYFDDSIDLTAFSPYKISSIKLFYTNQFLFGIHCTYYSFKNQQVIRCREHKPSKLFGVSEQKMTLLNDEYITHITVYSNESGIARLALKSNRQELVIGLQEGEKRELKVSEGFQLGAVAGGLDKQLRFLEWALIPRDAPRNQPYISQLYQVFLQTVQPPVRNTTFEFIGRQYRVCEPEIVDKGLGKKYVKYQIVDDQKQVIFRRHKDFILLREILASRWPGVYIPPLLGKTSIEDYSQDQIENTRKSCEYFLIKLSRIPFFVGAVEFGLFINRTTQKEEEEMDFVFNQLKEMTRANPIEQVSMRYKGTFEEFENKEPVNESQRLKCNAFMQLAHKLELLKTNDFAELKKMFELNSKNVNSLSRYFLPSFHELHNIVEMRKRSNSIENAVQLQFDSMNDIQDFFISEQREGATLYQCMAYVKELESQKIKLEQKLEGGKLPEVEAALMKERLNAIHSIWSILVKLYANYYIDKFHEERYQLYLFMLNRFAQIQLSNLRQRENFWLNI